MSIIIGWEKYLITIYNNFRERLRITVLTGRNKKYNCACHTRDISQNNYFKQVVYGI